MKRIILTICLLFFSLASTAQNFYEFNWSSNDVDYKGFLIYNNSTNMIMRVGYTLKNGTYNVAEYNCTMDDYLNPDGKRIIKYNGDNAKVVFNSSDTEGAYFADNFYFIDVDENNHFKKLYVNDDQENSSLNTEVTFVKLNPKTHFTKKYLNRFYKTSSVTYKKLINTETTTESTEPITNLVSKIRFIAIGDTNDSKLSSSAIKDIQAYKRFLKMAAKNLNIPFESNIYVGDNFTKDIAINGVKNLAIGKREVVFFLYRGHGFRWADQSSNFPRMRLGDAFKKESYNIKDLYSNMKNKSPRLLIAIGDLCNDTRGLTPINTSATSPFIQNYTTLLELEKLKKLLKKKGALLTVSASPGEVSHANYDYGYYSKSFLDTLKWSISGLNTEGSGWNTILSTAKENANTEAVSTARTTQNAMTLNQIN